MFEISLLSVHSLSKATWEAEVVRTFSCSLTLFPSVSLSLSGCGAILEEMKTEEKIQHFLLTEHGFLLLAPEEQWEWRYQGSRVPDAPSAG